MPQDRIGEIASALFGGLPAGIGSKYQQQQGVLNNPFDLDSRQKAAWARTKALGPLQANFFPADARLDEEGNVICLSQYGRRNSEFGWEIDHHQPSALGGSDNHYNLRALHWKANCIHGGLLAAFMQKNT